MNENTIIYETRDFQPKWNLFGEFERESDLVVNFAIMENVKLPRFYANYNPLYREELANGTSSVKDLLPAKFQRDKDVKTEDLERLYQIAQQRHPDTQFVFTQEAKHQAAGMLWITSKDPLNTTIDINNFPQFDPSIKIGYVVLNPTSLLTEPQLQRLDRGLNWIGYRRIII